MIVRGRIVPLAGRVSRHLPAFMVAACLAAGAGNDARSQTPVRFQIDTAASSLNLVPATFSGISVVSGTRLASTVGVIQQFAGSMSTSVSGTLFGTLNGSTLTLNSQTSIVAVDNPAGPIPPPSSLTGSTGMVDVFGGLAVRSDGSQYSLDSTLAIRDIKAQVTSGSISIGAVPSSVMVQVTDGVIDLVDPPFESDPPYYYFYTFSEILDPVSFPNLTTQTVTGSFSGTITIPYALHLDFGSSGRVELAGSVVARRVVTPGDFNVDGVVNGLDLTRWRTAYGLNSQADANSDGKSSGSDFLLWQRNLGNSGAIVAVAEPTGLFLAATSQAALFAFGPLRRRSRRIKR